MKKIICLILAVLMLCLSLTACNGGTPETTAGTAEAKAQGPNPADDGVFTLLMVGNSFTSYYADEIYEALTASGLYESVKVYEVYASGCTLTQHAGWLAEENPKYVLSVYSDEGVKVYENVHLKFCASLENWDAISMQERSRLYDQAYTGVDPIPVVDTALTVLLGYFKELFPQAQYLWHATWSYEIGRVFPSGDTIDKKEQVDAMTEGAEVVAKHVQEKYGMTVISTNLAWKEIRYDPILAKDDRFEGQPFSLMSRFSGTSILDDYAHDGDIGGGQYLNALIWYEVITGKNCEELTWTPSYKIGGSNTEYALPEEKIALIKPAAHKAALAYK